MRIVLALLVIAAVPSLVYSEQITDVVSALDIALKASILTAIAAITAVLFSQWCFDERQKKQHDYDRERQDKQNSEDWERQRAQHDHDLKIREYEIIRDKAEQISNLVTNTRSLSNFICIQALLDEAHDKDQLKKQIAVNNLIREYKGLVSQVLNLLELYFDMPSEMNIDADKAMINYTIVVSDATLEDLSKKSESELNEIENAIYDQEIVICNILLDKAKAATNKVLSFWD